MALAACFFCLASAFQHEYVQAHHVIVAVGIQSRPGTDSSTMATAAPAFELNSFFMSAALACFPNSPGSERLNCPALLLRYAIVMIVRREAD
mgnify:CR=1 FL=1